MASLAFFCFDDPRTGQADRLFLIAIVDYVLAISTFFFKPLIVFPLGIAFLLVVRCLTSARKSRAPRGDKLPIRANERRRYIGKDSLGENKCSICLEEFPDKSDVAVLRDCEHVFHVACVASWTERNTSCPVCRRVVDELLVSTIVEDQGVLDMDMV